MQQLRSTVSDLRLIADVSRSCLRNAELDDPLHFIRRSQILTGDSEAVEGRETSRRTPVSTSSSAPTRPMNFASRPSVGSIPLRKSRLPVCAASTQVPNGSGGDESLMPSAFNRCSALAGREPLRVAFCFVEFGFIDLAAIGFTSILPRVIWEEGACVECSAGYHRPA